VYPGFIIFLIVWGGMWLPEVSAFSLFHRPEEIQKVHEMRQNSQKNKGSSLIHLSGYVYGGESLSYIWINGKAYTPEAMPNLKILATSPFSVSFQVNHEGESIVFTLAPNQHYCLEERKVGLGRYKP
tara:strand:- start:3705 stop:4085 length:381 start_codon:yes stop_codon:yes gene_type:complete